VAGGHGEGTLAGSWSKGSGEGRVELGLEACTGLRRLESRPSEQTRTGMRERTRRQRNTVSRATISRVAGKIRKPYVHWRTFTAPFIRARARSPL